MKALNIAERIERYCELMNLTAVVDISGSSSSCYVTVSDESKNLVIKVRISDHVLPPSYDSLFGEPDFELAIGEMHPEAHSVNWCDVVDFVASSFQRELPKGVITARKRAHTLMINKNHGYALIENINRDERIKAVNEYNDMMTSALASIGPRAELARKIKDGEASLIQMDAADNGNYTVRGRKRKNLKRQIRHYENRLKALTEQKTAPAGQGRGQ